MRDDVQSLFIAAVLWLIYIVSLGAGITGLAVCRKKKKESSWRWLYRISVILPILCIISMYAGVPYREAPFNEEALNNMANAVQEEEIENTADYFNNDIMYYIEGYAPLKSCDIGTRVEPVEPASESRLYKALTKEITNDNGTFICYPVCSQRDAVHLHYGYSGIIDYVSPDGKRYSVSYDILRAADTVLGVICSPPLFDNYDIAEVIRTATPTSQSAAYVCAEAYIKENRPDCSEYFCELYEVTKYNEDLNSGNPTGTYGSPYNKAVFPQIDEKYNDSYVLIYCNNELFNKVTDAVLIITEKDTGKILNVIERQGDGFPS